MVKVWLQYVIKTLLYMANNVTIDDNFFNDQASIQNVLNDDENDILEAVPVDESYSTAAKINVEYEMYIWMSLGKWNVPVSLLFDEHAEELSFPQIFWDSFANFR